KRLADNKARIERRASLGAARDKGRVSVTRTLALRSASIIALCASGVLAAPTNVLAAAPASVILYSQNNDPNTYPIDSSNLTSGSSSTYNASGADDFVIPSGHKWRIKEVDVAGAYNPGPGPATSENVLFYKNNRGL